MSFLGHLLFNNVYTPPPVKGVRKHRLMNEKGLPSPEPVQARTKIMEVLHEYEWMTVEEIARKTGLAVPTVAKTTDRMYSSKRIERTKRVHPAHGKINIYRKK